MSLLDKEPVKRVEKFLKDFDQSLEVIILKNSARTEKDAAKALNSNVGAIVKSLLFRAGDDFILCLVAGDKRCSLNKLKIGQLIYTPSMRYEPDPNKYDYPYSGYLYLEYQNQIVYQHFFGVPYLSDSAE